LIENTSQPDIVPSSAGNIQTLHHPRPIATSLRPSPTLKKRLIESNGNHADERELFHAEIVLIESDSVSRLKSAFVRENYRNLQQNNGIANFFLDTDVKIGRMGCIDKQALL
jgi:hypothetical protein